ncbi:RagB/SusD family nutrient uptake outer membrane protein [Chitinophaga oryzae]|uniref:RagB/SusD family nutrient uptake outer membrane protein n=1 Tax=Chitinophaga oryzae TaxID=2725414 RepID=A0AAE6ZGE1_9BACT|nr:RagB/SusD family nutrient uptake outer membrane protein [Chitinophaga oryzae]QJB31717.1 RagB/SusD family nutrient uptake outer membrane protein [Chitinophaga oryzae]
MKTRFRYIKHVCVSLLLVGSGCSKSFLELDPPSQIVESNFFRNEKEAGQALAGVYHVLQWNQWMGFHPTHCWSEAASDDAYSGGGSQSDGVGIKGLDQFRTVTIGDQTYRGLWSIYYAGIARANVYLEKIGKVTASDEFRRTTIAEAKFLRAYFYFELVRWYENVPLVTVPLVDAAQYNQPQAKPEAVFNQIAKDLEEAMADLPKTTQRQVGGHATYWGAKALMARVYLFYKGVYNLDLQAGSKTINKTVARDYLEDIISNGGFKLAEDFASIWRKAGEFGPESVFEVSHSGLIPVSNVNDQRLGQGNLSVHMFAPRGINDPVYTAGWSYSTITQSLYDEFEPNDPRRDQTILYGRDFSAIAKSWQYTGYFNKKYATHIEYKAGANSDANWGNNYRSIRYADVLLMAAELWLGDNQGKADAYLKQVRDRVKMPEVKATVESIRHERRVEFAGEGIRYWDLLRYGLDYAKKAIDASGTRGADYDGDQSRFNMDWDVTKRGRLPIPQQEVDIANGVLKQNPGY